MAASSMKDFILEQRLLDAAREWSDDEDTDYTADKFRSRHS